MTTYPNREHEQADRAARRRALTAILHLTEELTTLTHRLDDPRAQVDGSETQRLTTLTRDLTEHLTILGRSLDAIEMYSSLETLRGVREWHAADQAGDVVMGLGGHAHISGGHAGWKGHDKYAVHRHLSTGIEWELHAGDGTPVTVVPG